VPVRLTVWGLPLALSLTLKVAVRLPGAVGAKVTLIAQLPFAATELPQLLDCPKSPELAPVTWMLLIVTVEPAPLVRVRIRAVLVVPTA